MSSFGLTRRTFLAAASAFALPAAEWRRSDAFRCLYNLDFDQAIALLERESAVSSDPDPSNNLAYAILYRAMFRADALDGDSVLSIANYLHKPKVPIGDIDRGHFNSALWRAQELAKAMLARNPKDANALYALGVSETHKANIALLIDKEWRTALKTGGEARTLHSQAFAIDKNLVDAQLVPSMHEYIVGSLPIYVKALGFLVGFTGDKEKGIRGIRDVSTRGVRSKLEATVLLALIEHREQRPSRSAEIMRGLAAEFPSNHLYRKELATLLLDSRRKDEARREFAELKDSRYRFMNAERFEAYRRQFEAKLQA